MKILHVLSSSKFSGAENVVCQIIKMFDNEIEMAYTSKDGEIAKALLERGVKFFPMEDLNHEELARVIKEYQPDLLHGHDIRGAYEASRFAKEYKVIHTIHGNDVRMRKLSLKSLLYKKAAKKAQHIFWVSSSCLSQYKFYNSVKEKSEVLVNVIDTTAAVEKGKEEAAAYDALYIGRLSYPKNPQRYVEVIRKAVEKKPDLSAAILGKGEDEESVKELIKKYHLEKNLTMLGFESNPLKYLAKTKVLILTSDWEGTPMVSLEAMALGIPVVSTPTDGMCDVIEEGKNGFLSKEEDVLADKLLALLSDVNLWEEMHRAQLAKSAIVNNVETYKAVLKKAYMD